MKKICLMQLGAVALLWIVGCQGGASLRDRMEEAEALMDSRPDSACFILESVSAKELDTKRLRAEHSLLLSMALDKNFVDLTSDTLINVAVDYYRRYKDYEKLFQSLYYQGRVYENAGQYSKAMLSFTEAEQIIDEVENNFAKGLLYAHLGNLYDRFYNYPKSLECYVESERFHHTANCINHVYYAKISIGCVYINMNQSEDAEQILKEVIEWGEVNNAGANIIAKERLANLYMRLGKAADYWTLVSHDEKENNPKGYATLAYQYALKDNKVKACEYLDLAWLAANTLSDTTKMYDYAYNVYKQIGDYEMALNAYENLYSITDRTIRSAMQEPLVEVQRDYFHSQAENHVLKLRSTRIVLAAGCIIAALALMLIVVYYRFLLDKKQRNLDDYISLYQELEGKLSERENEIDSIHTQVRRLFSNQYDLLNQLCQISYENPGSSKAGAIYSKVTKEIDSFKSDSKFYSKLEQIVNEYNNDVMRKLKEGLPKLSPQEYHMFCFFCAGFSPKAISILTDEPLAHLYVKKMRLKEKILKKKPQYWQEIMGYLG